MKSFFFAFALALLLPGCTTADKDYIREHVADGKQTVRPVTP